MQRNGSIRDTNWFEMDCKILTGTEEGRAFVESETTPSGFELISAETSDEEIDRRVAKIGK
jgi:hypothetical protein